MVENDGFRCHFLTFWVMYISVLSRTLIYIKIGQIDQFYLKMVILLFFDHNNDLKHL